MNLAGFDLIIELSRGFLEDSLYSAPRSVLLTTGDQDTFAPPFTLQMPLTASGLTFNATFIVQQLTLNAQPGGSGFALVFTFRDASIIGANLPPLSLLNGTITVTAQFGIVFDNNNAMSLGALLGAATVNTLFDQKTRDKLNALQAGLADKLQRAISDLLQAALRAKGAVPLVPLPFTVDGTKPSGSLNVLTSTPLLRWTDTETLALFGRYRPGTSDPALKNDSDLDKTQRRAIATLLSPEAFRQVIACPIGVAGIVRDKVGEPKYDQFVNEEKIKDGNKKDPTPAEQNRAHQRVEDEYLNTPEGRQAIKDQTPAPCGSGALKMHVNPPDPFPGTDAYVRQIEMKLGAGGIDVHLQADAEIFCGTVNVSQDQHFPFKVSAGRIRLDAPRKLPPSTNFDGSFLCRAALVAIGGVMGSITLGLIGNFLGFSLAAFFLEDLIGEKFNEQDTKPNVNVSFLKDADWKEVVCQADGLLFRGVMYGDVIDPVPFEPTVTIDMAIASPNPLFIITHHASADQLTGIACVPAAGTTFGYSKSALSHTITVQVSSRDVPLPLTVSQWWMRIGHKTSHRNFAYDPVRYGETTFPLVAGPFTTQAAVWNPEPPLDGAVVDPMAIAIDVKPSGNGFALATSAANLNYFLQITAAVIDAAGKVWLPKVDVGVDGVVIVLDPDAQKFIDDCDRKLSDLNQNFAKSHPVGVWDTHAVGEDRMREDLVSAMRNRYVGLTRVMADASKILGEATANRMLFGSPKV